MLDSIDVEKIVVSIASVFSSVLSFFVSILNSTGMYGLYFAMISIYVICRYLLNDYILHSGQSDKSSKNNKY